MDIRKIAKTDPEIRKAAAWLLVALVLSIAAMFAPWAALRIAALLFGMWRAAVWSALIGALIAVKASVEP